MHVRRGKTVGESHAETTRMARRLFVSPPARRMVLPILVFSIMEAFLLVYPALDGWRVVLGTAAIALPAYASAVATVPLAERLGGKMYFRRSFLLAFVGLILLGAFAILVMLFAPKGIWGYLAERYDLAVFPVQRRLVLSEPERR